MKGNRNLMEALIEADKIFDLKDEKVTEILKQSEF